MANDKENQPFGRFADDEALEEEITHLFSFIVNKCSKSINFKLLKEHTSNYFDFIENIQRMTSNPNNFMNLTQLEEQMTILIQKSKQIAVDLAADQLTKIDEGPIIQKKKEECLENGVKLRIYRKVAKTITTVHGKVDFKRTALLPCADSDGAKLSELGKGVHVYPLDESIGMSELPFKITVSAMLEIAYWVQGSSSYDAAARFLARNSGIKLDAATVRLVANNIGKFVFENDRIEAGKALSLLNSGKLEFPTEKVKGVFYIETDGAMLHTRQKDDRGSSYKENKLGMVFASDGFIRWTNKKNETVYSIGKREYVTFVGEAEEFKLHLFALALRNGYGKYEQTVLISDGATWIRHMKEELFPDAQQILDFFHLSENITDFAKAVFDMDETKYKPWADKVIVLFKASKTEKAIEEINALGKKRIAKSKSDIINYIYNNRNNIDYAKYRKLGYFIGSGAIESANRTVLQERLKRPGMRWNKDNGQFVLSLMSKAKSDMSRKGRAEHGVWERDVERAIREKYDTAGFA
jgi:hypothetical protein